LTPTYTPFQSPEERSQIFIELINSETNDYARDFETAEDFVSYTIENEFGVDSETTETEIDGQLAVRSSPIINDARHRQTILYAMLRDDGWAVLASINAPDNPSSLYGNNIESGEAELLSILESLEFDADSAERPFERNLAVYNTSGVMLEESYISDDGLMMLQYSSDWEIENADILSTMVANISYYVEFKLAHENITVEVMLIKIGDEYFNQPRDEDTPEEYLYASRNSEDSDVQQFRIGEFDAVKLIEAEGQAITQTITYALDDSWIAMVIMSSASETLLNQYESTVVAVMETITYTTGANFIDSPILNVSLPDPWQMVRAEQYNGVYQFFLVSSDEARLRYGEIIIFVANLETLGAVETAKEGLEALLSEASTVDYETEIITIDDYEVLRSNIATVEESGGANFYAAASLFLVDANWMFFAITQSGNQEDIPEMLETIDTIITTMEITLPED
jgi:hypothetical protein